MEQISKIRLLDESTINKIAAGEVIERPANVVKELVENAIDAQASAVTVEIQDGGLSLVRITDNGIGIAKEDVPNAFVRHATSKIRTADDLNGVLSLGFRGEALASVAAVSVTEMITKTHEELTGVRCVMEGGRETVMSEIGCPEGTTVLVRNLFYNTPARKKFLKTPMSEGAHVGEVMEKLALSHPEVSFRFINGRDTKLLTNGSGDVKALIYSVFGRDIAANLLPVSAELPPYRLTGFIGKPVISRGNRGLENFFINGRTFHSAVVSKAAEDAYQPYSMTRRYPFTVLLLTAEGGSVDVNVHPSKLEVRFADNEKVYQLVRDALKHALSSVELIPDAEFGEAGKQPAPQENRSAPEPFEQNRRREELPAGRREAGEAEGRIRETGFYRAEQHTDAGTAQQAGFRAEQQADPMRKLTPDLQREIAETEIGRAAGVKPPLSALGPDSGVHQDSSLQNQAAEEPGVSAQVQAAVGNQAAETGEAGNICQDGQLDLFGAAFLDPSMKKQRRIIGQVFATYWIVEQGKDLYFIDQHAAHEKIRYEHALKRYREQEAASQALDPPIIISLSTAEEATVRDNEELLSEMGFLIEPFGGHEYQVRAVPMQMDGIEEKQNLVELIGELSSGERSGPLTPESVLAATASWSCKGAVKGNERLSVTEAESLIDQLFTLENPYHCPHGRPVIISMSRYELEKKFKRIVT